MLKPKIIFILSSNYSGSHLLTHLISSHSRACSVGELKNLNKFLNRPSETHSVFHDYATNPLFKMLHTLPEKEWHVHLLEKIRVENDSIICLVDNSKKIGWAEKFINNPELEAICIHLIRDPRALARRWDKTFTDENAHRQRVKLALKQPLYGLKTVFKSNYDVYAYKWLIQNTRITNFLAKTNQQKNVISYSDLVSDTSAVLEKIMKQVGLNFEEGQLNYGRSKHIGTIKKDYVEQTKNSTIEEDLRWKEDLPPSASDGIKKNKDINRYLKSINLKWTNNGISAVTNFHVTKSEK